MVDASGTSDYIYDDLGRLTSVTETRGSLSFTTSYSYDAAGVLTGITLPSGRDVDYTLNGNGQVSSVAADVNGFSTTLASSISYLPFGPMSSLTYGNSIGLTNTHNSAYELTNRQTGSMMNDGYTYDAAGNITIKGITGYTLDNLYRITGEGSDSYTYDAIGNRTAKNSDTYVYPSTSSKVMSIGGVSLTHDAAGSLTTDTQRSYTIDAVGRVKEVKISGSTVGAYVYNANNQRTKKTASGVVTHYVYGQGGLLYGEYDASGNMLVEYVYLNGEPLAQIDDVSSSDVLIYLHTDHQGTPRYASNTIGSQVWAWSSDAFGVGTPTGSAMVNLRFPGQYFDEESDLHYNWNRYYDPETGRYISSDPIGLIGGLNTFGYAMANSVMFTDPEGLTALPSSSPSSAPSSVPANDNTRPVPRSVPQTTVPEIPWWEVVRGVAGRCIKAAGTKVIGIASIFIPDNETCKNNIKLCESGDCGLFTRQEAYKAAQAIAQIPRKNREEIPVTDIKKGVGGREGSRGKNCAEIQRNGGNVGYRCSWNPDHRIEDHPDGHPGTPGLYHNCPHMHVYDKDGNTIAKIPYKFQL